MSSPLTAVIATPTSWADWVRRWAVTTTSSSAVVGSPASAVVDAASAADNATAVPVIPEILKLIWYLRRPRAG